MKNQSRPTIGPISHSLDSSNLYFYRFTSNGKLFWNLDNNMKHQPKAKGTKSSRLLPKRAKILKFKPKISIKI